MVKTMRKFSKKSKKEKKNAIHRKTKENRRNNKRRTYRKKMKGGFVDPIDKIKKNVMVLDDIFVQAIKGYKDITDLRHYKVRFNKKVTELARYKSSCQWSYGNTEECRKNKKYLFTLTVIRLNYYDKILDVLIDHLNNNSTISSPDETISLVNNFKEIIDDNITAIKNEATSRGAIPKDFNIDILKLEDLELNENPITANNIDEILKYIKDQVIERNKTKEFEEVVEEANETTPEYTGTKLL